MSLSITPEQLQKMLEEAARVANEGFSNASSTSIGETLKNELLNNSNAIQDILNSFLSNVGAITQDKVNALDEQIRIQKLKMLQLQSEKTKKRYYLYIGLGIVGIGALWLIAKIKK